MSKENYEFQAEVGKILNIVANSLYSEKEIFLRELISNASDACDKLRYEALQDQKIKISKEFKILISFSKKNKTISITDNGIGMNKDELINSLGTIAKSGTEEFIKKLEEKPSQRFFCNAGIYAISPSTIKLIRFVPVVKRRNTSPE